MYLIFTKKLKWWKGIMYVGIIGIICVPIMLFILINTRGGNTIHLLWMTIPKLTHNRFGTVTNIFSNKFFEDGFRNLRSGITILLTQDDGSYYNAIPGFGTLFLISTPFTIIGMFKKYEKNISWIIWMFRIWFIVSIMMMFIVSPNINRINIVFMPLVVFTTIGIYDITAKTKEYRNIVYGSYIVSSVVFAIFYTTEWNKNMKSRFFESFGDAIVYANKIDNVNHYYVTSNVNMPYIFVCYYTGQDTREFIETVNYVNPNGQFRAVSEFGNYSFSLPSILTEGNVYIVDIGNNRYKDYDLSTYKVTYFERYYVIDTTI